jgi:hypothetical protein
MFGRKKKQISSSGGVAVAGGAAPSEVVSGKEKGKTTEVKPPSPREVMAGEIEQLSAGQFLRYKLPPFYGDDLAVIQMNPDYPQKGRKYRLGSESIIDGKPSGKINFIWDTDKPADLAKWVLERLGVQFN